MNFLKRLSCACLLILLSSRVAAAQTGAPAGWRWALDSAATHVAATDVVPPGSFGFVEMAPGWHVTMGPGGLLYHPRQIVQGRFSINSSIALFPGDPPAEYGLFFGGDASDPARAAWCAFVLRRDRSAAVIRMQNGRLEQLIPWTKNDTIRGGAEGGSNALSIVADSVVTFRVNGVSIGTLPRARVTVDGLFGFRIGRALNLHITTLDVTHRLAPAR